MSFIYSEILQLVTIVNRYCLWRIIYQVTNGVLQCFGMLGRLSYQVNNCMASNFHDVMIYGSNVLTDMFE